METIGQRELRSFLSESAGENLREDDDTRRVSCSQVRKDNGVPVRDYLDLAQKVATVQFYNPDYIFLYRGQAADYRRKRATTLKPPIFRAPAGSSVSDQGIPTGDELTRRYDVLRRAEQLLLLRYPHRHGAQRLRRQRILRWAILQHYEVCDTPLLDVTQSLRIAAAFATIGADDRAFVYMLGLPNLSAAITASAEAGLQVVRLSTACPPEARRPHLQEGYLIGEYPDISDVSQKENYGLYEVDFGRRLVAKFCFDPQVFWVPGGPYPAIPREALYPDDGDALVDLRNSIRSDLGLGS
ncbi:FRG domain-containing protein [uncultured Phenylobacterium sp.]|uniref:FRG domain-containing protein n=1 Tax=uncultured Phenylobacterium sp. TaxID=349273 RepID=UPI0026009688|nr:FRG domain-containing protein [uncultured Phenylobacterium sp.]